MIITCPSCMARFAVRSEDIHRTGRRVRCGRCRHDWFQYHTEESLEEETTYFSEDMLMHDGSNLPAIINHTTPPLHMKWAFASSIVLFLICLSIVSSNKILPHFSWYYNIIGIHDDSGITLYNVAAEKIGEGSNKGLLVKGRIVNDSKNSKAIPNLRITLLGSDRRKLQDVMLNSNDVALAPGEGVDFENFIAKPTEAADIVVMDIGNSVNLAAR